VSNGVGVGRPVIPLTVFQIQNTSVKVCQIQIQNTLFVEFFKYKTQNAQLFFVLKNTKYMPETWQPLLRDAIR